MKTIVIYADPQTREVTIDFPVPEGGPIKPESRAGEPKAILSFKNRTKEQLAHYVFWQDGTNERIQAIIKEREGAGIRLILSWLIRVRIHEAFKKTGGEFGGGYKYGLKMITSKDDWELHQSLKGKEND